MKQPSAPVYLELPTEGGQNYRLQKISEIEKQLIRERGMQEKQYVKYIFGDKYNRLCRYNTHYRCSYNGWSGDSRSYSASFRNNCYCIGRLRHVSGA